MAKQKPFNVIHDVLRISMEKAFEAVEIAVAAEKSAIAQKAMLEQYRSDYLKKLQTMLTEGILSSQVQNTQRFIDTIDEAISRQSTNVQQMQRKVEQARSAWQEKRRGYRAMGVLVGRADAQSRAAESRREQKDNDEYANRQYARALTSA